ncbi:MAG TPA: hypothetical protein VMB05_11935 [Solirubrobacteraceae bacterium]|nr:hypothetical protein [Solirubrobacteraceae bacterium]
MQIELSLRVMATLIETEKGGRQGPISASSYRPWCRVRDRDGSEVLIGMCEMRFDGVVAPGETSEGELVFAEAEPATRLLPVGTKFEFIEGLRSVASCEVLAARSTPPPKR